MLIGTTQNKVITRLSDLINKGEPPHLVLLTGSSGIGKTTIAKWYVNQLGIIPDAVQHINCVDSSGVSYVRDVVVPSLQNPPIFGSHRIAWILDEFHGWASKAQDTLLVELENILPHAFIIAASTEPQAISDALRSRFGEHCYNLTPPSRKDLTTLIKTEIPNILPQDGTALITESGGNVRTLLGLIAQYKAGTYVSLATNDTTKSINTLLDYMRKKDYPAIMSVRFENWYITYVQLGMLALKYPNELLCQNILTSFANVWPEKMINAQELVFKGIIISICQKS